MKLTQRAFDLAIEDGPVRFTDDCNLICALAQSGFGIDMTPKQAETVWENWSASQDAQWLGGINYQTLGDALRLFVEERLKIELE